MEENTVALNIRQCPVEVAREFRSRAARAGLTQAQYLAKLLEEVKDK